MDVAFTARNLVAASWAVPASRVERDLPEEVELSLTPAGRALVSVVALGVGEPRAGGRRVPSFAQLTVQTSVRREGEPGIFLFSVRVRPVALVGAVLGAPLRPARIRVSEGRVEAPGLGVSARYRPAGETPEVPSAGGTELGSEQVALFLSAGLRRLPVEHDPFVWESVDPEGPSRFDPVLALGFDVGGPDSLLYARSTPFRLRLPAEKLG